MGGGEVLITSSSSHIALAPPSEYTLEVLEGSSTRCRHSETAGDGEEEEEEAPNAARTVAGHDEPISEPETRKQRHAVLPASNPPAQRNAGLALLTDSSPHLEVNKHNRTLAPRNATFTQAVAHPTVKVSGGFDVSYRAPGPEWQSQQADYHRILQDKFDASGPRRGHRYSDTDEASTHNVDDGNSLPNLVDADNESNESYSGRHSLKSVSQASCRC
jgi:hypothetical protein